MKQFNKIINEIINDINTELPCEFSINSINKIIKPKYKWFGLYRIINEYVEDKETTPIPKEFFIDICKNIKTREFQILKYSYNQISNMLTNYQYEFAEDFKNNLKDKDGYLYIISSKQISDNLTNDQYIEIYNILSMTFSEDEISNIIDKCSQEVTGITSTLKIFDKTYKDVFIFINQNKIVKRSWTSTLEHELTHFVQRIVGFDKSLKRTTLIAGKAYDLYIKNKEFFDNLFNISNNSNKLLFDSILEFIYYITKQAEQDQSLKHIEMEFQREYERHNKEISSYKDDPILQKNINQRMNWLTNTITKITDNNFLKSIEWKNKLNLIEQDFDNLSINNKIIYNYTYAIIGYLIYKKLVSERNINERLFNHFKTFKYRDN